MSTKQLLRGHRARKARRFLKRHPESYVIGHLPNRDGKLGLLIFGPARVNDGAQPAAQDWHLGSAENYGAVTELLQEKEEGESLCTTCGATGDNPCVTKSGKIASKEHASRRSL